MATDPWAQFADAPGGAPQAGADPYATFADAPGASKPSAAPAAVVPPPQRTSQGLGLWEGVAGPIDRTARRLDAWSQDLGIPMDKINRALGMPTAAESGQAYQKTLSDAAARGVKPGALGEFAGNTALGVATAPAGLLSGGLVTGALLSKAPSNDVSGFLKDTAVGGAVGKIGGEAINRTISGIGNAAAKALTNSPAAAATVARLQAAKGAAYDRVKQLGIQYNPQAIDGLWQDIGRTMSKFQAHPDRHSAAFQTLDQMGQDVVPGQPASLDQLDKWRQIIFRDVVDSGDKATAALGTKLAKTINDFQDSVTGADMHMPGATPGAMDARAQQGVLALNAAQTANKAYRNVELINRKASSGLSKAARTYGGHNIDNRLRQSLGPLIDPDSPQNASRFLSPDEQQGLSDLVHGTPVRNFMRNVGQFSPSDNPLKALVSLGAAGASHGLSLGLSGAGFLAKLQANAATKKAVGNLVDMMANGGTQASALAARQLRTMALKNSNVGQWAKAIGLDLGEYGTSAATVGAVNAQRHSPSPLEVTVDRSTNPDYLAWKAQRDAQAAGQ